MGESSACLVRSFSQPSSPTSTEEKKRNSLQRAALTSSISFGRFVSESLDWEKFSAFTQNRYLEEAEKFSKPGSVAEKKAYFEAHYKRRRAAALLEQQNAALAAASNFSERNTVNEEVKHDSYMESTHSDTCLVVIKETQEEEVCNCEQDASVSPSGRDAEIDTKLDEVTQVSKPYVPTGDLVELSAHVLEDSMVDRCIGDVSSHVDKKCEDGSTPRILTSSTEKKPEGCSSSKKVLKNISLIKQVSSVQQRNKNSTLTDLSNKRTRSNSTSLHMSINFDSCSGESQKVKYPGLPKMSNSKLVRTPAKKPQNSSPPQTSASSVNSVNGTFKNHSASPSVAKRNMNLHHDSISGSEITEGKVKTLLKSHSKSSSTAGTKARSETVSSSFIFKSEERAARRKEFFEKLEQKNKPDISDKQQRSTKTQVTAGSTTKDHLKPNRNAKISITPEPPSNLIKKTTTSTLFSPKVKERAAIRVQENSNDSTRPPWKFSPKTANSMKDNRPPSSSAKPFLKKKKNISASENTSPNIPLR